VRRQKAKALAARNFLSRKVSKRINTIVDRFPDIGDTIETFVSNSNIGADAWRRTGVLTFDGNLRVNKKVTYERIRQHLMDKYNHKFSYGRVIQLCVARNRRRRASENYRGVAKVTTRRARKGFELRYNPDKHWSSSLYRVGRFMAAEQVATLTATATEQPGTQTRGYSRPVRLCHRRKRGSTPDTSSICTAAT